MEVSFSFDFQLIIVQFLFACFAANLSRHYRPRQSMADFVQSPKNIFESYLLAGVTVIFNLQLLWAVGAVYIVSSLLVHNFTFKNVLAALLGLATPYYLYYVWTLCWNS